MAEPLNVHQKESRMQYHYGSDELQARTTLQRLLNDPQLIKMVQRIARQELRLGQGIEGTPVAPHRLGRTERTNRAALNHFICHSIINFLYFRNNTPRHSRVRRSGAGVATKSTE